MYFCSLWIRVTPWDLLKCFGGLSDLNLGPADVISWPLNQIYTLGPPLLLHKHCLPCCGMHVVQNLFPVKWTPVD